MDQVSLPSREECETVLLREAGQRQSILEHSRLVAAVAERLGEELNRWGASLNLSLLWAAGCLHDIAKGQPRHALVGAALLRQLGWPAVADIVAVHMDVPVTETAPVTAAEVVYLADKLTEGSKVVGLDRRFAAVGERYPDDPIAQRNIVARLQKARLIQSKVERLSGRTIAEITQGCC